MGDSNTDKYNTIVHLWTAGPFMDDSTYQETMLANGNKKKHKRVFIVTTNLVYGLDDTVVPCECSRYTNSHGVEIVRLKTHRPDLSSRRDFIGIFKELCEIKPDFIMNHVFNPTSCMAIHMYKKKNPECKVVADSHMTRCNSYGEVLTVREKIICVIMRLTGLLCYKDVDKFYGITRQTVDMMVDLYGVPSEKAEFLPLGFDSDYVNFDVTSDRRKDLVRNLGISDDKLVFISGGKLSPPKKILELVKAFNKIDNAALVVFGDFSDKDYETRTKEEAGENVYFVGSLKQKQIYDHYLASDIAVFPGSPSCLRQEAVACGLPIIISCNQGDEDTNILIDSNGILLSENWDIDELVSAMSNIIMDYAEYKKRARSLAEGEYLQYSYDRQAEFILKN